MKITQAQNYDSSFEQVLHKRSDLHILRKLWHISTGSLCLFIFLRSGDPQIFWAHAIMVMAIAGFAVDFLRKKYRRMNSIVIKIMGPLMRRSEREGMTGLPFYALGCSLALYFYDRSSKILASVRASLAEAITSPVDLS